MEHNLGVGILVGLVTASSLYVWNSIHFSKAQKTVLLVLMMLPPIQWIGILIVIIYNKNSVKTSLNSSINNLTELREKGIINEVEYYEKVAKITAEKEQQKIKNTKEYKQLKSLFNNGVLTKDEFENKVKNIKLDEVKTHQCDSEIPEQLLSKLIYRIRFSIGYLLIIFTLFSTIQTLISYDKDSISILFICLIFFIVGVLLIPNFYKYILNKLKIKKE